LAANGSFGTTFTIRCQIFGHPRAEDFSTKKLAGQHWQGTHRRKPNVPIETDNALIFAKGAAIHEYTMNKISIRLN
jgi:hypothetical protein